jgi:hypothetical protein
MTTAESYRKNIAKMCAEMSEPQLQRVLARVQHIWLTNCTSQKVEKNKLKIFEKEQIA